MKITVTRAVAIGGVHHEPGETVDVADEVGIRLTNMGKAQPAEGAPQVEDRAVGLTTKSAGPLVKRGAKKKAK